MLVDIFENRYIKSPSFLAFNLLSDNYNKYCNTNIQIVKSRFSGDVLGTHNIIYNTALSLTINSILIL